MRKILTLMTLTMIMVASMVILWAPSSIAKAATVTYTTTMYDNVTYDRPSGTCGDATTIGDVSFNVHEVTVTVSGTYTIANTDIFSGSGDTFVVLYQDGFDPENPTSNCMAANDDAGSPRFSLTTTLNTGTTYYVVSTYFNAVNNGSYEVEISGPGDITVNSPPIIVSNPPADGFTNIAYTHDFAAAGDAATYSVTAGALPDGLDISGNQITGTPTVIGDFTGTITATNDDGTDTQDFSITIIGGAAYSAFMYSDVTFNAAADSCTTVFGNATSFNVHEVTVAASGTYTIANTSIVFGNADTYVVLYENSFDPANPLTNCLAIDDDSGTDQQFSLTTTLNTGTTYYVVSTYLNTIDNGIYRVQISGPGDITVSSPPLITSAAPGNGAVGVAYTHDFAAAGDTATYSVTAGALPDGLSISDNQITGMPTVADTFTGTITATNDDGTDTQDFSITVGIPPSITSNPPGDGVIGVPYSYSVTADGDATITFEVTSGSLPGGLNLSAATGAITGTPDTLETATGEITATNSFGTDVQAFSITINPDNVAPVATDDTYTVVGGQELSETAPGVLTNDTDGDSDSLTAVLDMDVTNGTLMLNGDGSFVYTPDFGFMGDDTFTYFANDGTVNSDTAATVTITVSDPAGTPPRLYPYNEQMVDGVSYLEPNFQFRHVEGIAWYQIWIGSDTSTPPVTQYYFAWHPANNDAPFADGQGICDTVTDICTIPADIWLNNGDFSWWMTVWAEGDTTADINAAWNETTFSFAFGAPASTVTYTSPADEATVSAPEAIMWPRDPNAQWYRLWIGTDDYLTQVFFDWVDGTEACEEGVCTLDVSGLTFADDDYEIWTEVWGPNGYLTWLQVNGAVPSTFTVDSSGAVPAAQPIPRPTR